MSMNQSDKVDLLTSALGALLESVQAHLIETGYTPVVPSQLDLDIESAFQALQSCDEEG